MILLAGGPCDGEVRETDGQYQLIDVMPRVDLAAVMSDQPELSVREGERVPVGLPDGDCIVTELEDGHLRIDHADPRVLISAELVDEIADSSHPDCLLDTAGCRTYMGALLKVRGVNRQVIYRLVDWVPSIRAFIGEWPD